MVADKEVDHAGIRHRAHLMFGRADGDEIPVGRDRDAEQIARHEFRMIDPFARQRDDGINGHRELCARGVHGEGELMSSSRREEALIQCGLRIAVL